MTERPVETTAGHLTERVHALAAKAPVVVPDPTEPPDVGEMRAMGQQAWRGEAWRRIVPSRFVWATLDDVDDESVVGDIRSWAASNESSANLVLLGEVGVGKTHVAVAACRPAHDAGMSVAFWPVVELLDALRPGGPEDTLACLAAVDRLIVDDLGSERPTDWTAERLYALVNRRWLEERPTVFTTNLDPPALAEALGMRTYSRIVGCGAVVLRLTGKDRRRAARV